ncbi:hypothetical protein [Burkholderia sp. BCC1993]|uniref:esterase/lipase family protein n=1 Tax=Burkholderia sp. BCC1993 TaxID=2817444 RepID=UPI002AB0E482|nr:hypothetical protein [Burkholderia sp. BCC1993]
MATAETANEHSESGTKQAYRRVPLRFDENGNPYFDSVMSPDSFKVCALCTLPPRHVIPIIFVPGIMGTNLCSNDKTKKAGEPAWRPPNGKMAGLGEWFRRLNQSAADRQKQVGPERVMVDKSGKVSVPRNVWTLTNDEAKRRGWGELHFDSYGGILAELESALNEPYLETELPSDPQRPKEIWSVAQTLERVVKGKKIDVRAEWNPQGVTIEPLAPDEFSRVSKYYYPVWACGYNWLASNDASADQLIDRINEALAYYQKGSYWIPMDKVIIVTHSMGGLVARRAAQKLSERSSKGSDSDDDDWMNATAQDRQQSAATTGTSNDAPTKSCGKAGPDTILGIVHGVQPVGGAPVVYRRFRAGCEVNGSFNVEGAMVAVVMGWSAADIVCVMGNSPGPLELLPTKHFTPGWLQFVRPSYGGKTEAMKPMPIADPYAEIYAKRVTDNWWGMVDPKLINPANLKLDDKNDPYQHYKNQLAKAMDFHDNLELYCHPTTYAYYGADPKQVSFGEIVWSTKDEIGAEFEWILKDIVSENFDNFGKSKLSFGTQKVIFKLEEAPPPPKDGETGSDRTFSGDGTVPFDSGTLISESGTKPVTFRMTGFDHQMSYNNGAVRECVAWCIGKIVQLAPPIQ